MKIFYSLSGEGLGHAIRVASVLEALKDDIEVHLFTWGEAYDFFQKQNYPHLHKIAQIPFGRDFKNRISTPRTILNFFRFLANAPSSFLEVRRMVKNIKPSLIISDFECLMPRVAHFCGIPLFSIDNQHRFSRCEIQELPKKYKNFARLIGLLTEIYVPRPERVIISTFHCSTLKKLDSKTVLTNCFVRKHFEEHNPTVGDYVLLYYKSSFGGILEILAEIEGIKVKVYGCPPELRTVSKFEYFEISNEGFVEALAGCRHLISGSGNQLLGEAIYYGKPILAIPEHNQPEQMINAHYAEKMGFAYQSNMDELTSEKIQFFFDNFECSKGLGSNGARIAAKEIHAYLEGIK
ncbi:MAG: hypothetical protein DWQ19_12110 [Crenarchaeota archaeon]|nr:MAG: hypothetical protein DWQ19_12110 [Thermoproteota archaeon]